MDNRQSVERVVLAIELLAREGEAKLDTIAAHLGVHKSNTLRLLATLRSLGWVSRDETRSLYELGPRLITIGAAASAHLGLNEALSLAERLRDLSGESVHLAVPVEKRMLIVAKVDSLNALRVSCHLGSEDHLHSSSLGKAYLASIPDAELDEVLSTLKLTAATVNSITSVDRLRKEIEATRERGYSIDSEEGRIDVRCIGTTLCFGDQLIALSITGPANRWTMENMESVIPEMLRLVEIFRCGPQR